VFACRMVIFSYIPRHSSVGSPLLSQPPLTSWRKFLLALRQVHATLHDQNTNERKLIPDNFDTWQLSDLTGNGLAIGVNAPNRERQDFKFR
jgi:hypothetical protein